MKIRLLCVIFFTLACASLSFAGDASPQFSFRWQDLEFIRLIPYDDGQVGIEIKPKLEKAYELLKFTEANQGQKVTILLGDTVFSHPVIRSPLSNLTITAPNLETAIPLIRQLQPKSK